MMGRSAILLVVLFFALTSSLVVGKEEPLVGDPVELPSDVDWIRVEVPRLDVSSTDLRARFIDGRPLDYLVTESVLEVITERELYQQSAEQETG